MQFNCCLLPARGKENLMSLSPAELGADHAQLIAAGVLAYHGAFTVWRGCSVQLGLQTVRLGGVDAHIHLKDLNACSLRRSLAVGVEGGFSKGEVGLKVVDFRLLVLAGLAWTRTSEPLRFVEMESRIVSKRRPFEVCS